jgi:hypothetical protein
MAGPGDEALLRADVPAIHVLFRRRGTKDVDARHKAGHDDCDLSADKHAIIAMAGQSAKRLFASMSPPSTPHSAPSWPGVVPAIHVLFSQARPKDVDTRDIGAKQSFVASPGHDGTFICPLGQNDDGSLIINCPRRGLGQAVTRRDPMASGRGLRFANPPYPHNGRLSCFRAGISTCLFLSIASARAMRRRVECGMMTSSI